MSVPELLPPDDLVRQLLVTIFGPGATIVVVFNLANLVWSWSGLGRSGLWVGKASITIAGRVSGQLVGMRPVAIFLGAAISMTMLFLQSLWLWSSYVVGNAWSYFLTGDYPTQGPHQGPQWSRMLTSLHWDTISKGYVAACIVALIAAYVLAFTGRDPSASAYVLVAPAILVGILSALGAALALLVAFLNRLSTGEFEPDAYGKSTALLTAIVVAYVISCFVALGTPRLIGQVWKPTEKRQA